ncbi:hypothetical protein M0812_03511 [Anaeramoeba flamelloides]|uniref:Uncharacterized protein n=1 Tax=Anaeramoeba flamelloides TaxID=1746091 RepID=A0AAV8AG86_9EUKA|nr:hypothetical protein M0812_03511 [Anaeramoeba flamelloides]
MLTLVQFFLLIFFLLIIIYFVKNKKKKTGLLKNQKEKSHTKNSIHEDKINKEKSIGEKKKQDEEEKEEEEQVKVKEIESESENEIIVHEIPKMESDDDSSPLISRNPKKVTQNDQFNSPLSFLDSFETKHSKYILKLQDFWISHWKLWGGGPKALKILIKSCQSKIENLNSVPTQEEIQKMVEIIREQNVDIWKNLDTTQGKGTVRIRSSQKVDFQKIRPNTLNKFLSSTIKILYLVNDNSYKLDFADSDRIFTKTRHKQIKKNEKNKDSDNVFVIFPLILKGNEIYKKGIITTLV